MLIYTCNIFISFLCAFVVFFKRVIPPNVPTLAKVRSATTTDGSKKPMSKRVTCERRQKRIICSPYLPDREASLIKKEHCRLSGSPHSLQVTPPPRAGPYLLREGRPIGAHLWDSGGQLFSGQTSLHCTVGACLRNGGLAR